MKQKHSAYRWIMGVLLFMLLVGIFMLIGGAILQGSTAYLSSPLSA